MTAQNFKNRPPFAPLRIFAPRGAIRPTLGNPAIEFRWFFCSFFVICKNSWFLSTKLVHNFNALLQGFPKLFSKGPLKRNEKKNYGPSKKNTKKRTLKTTKTFFFFCFFGFHHRLQNILCKFQIMTSWSSDIPLLFVAPFAAHGLLNVCHGR